MTDSTPARLRLEAMLAGPPTKRCKEIRAALETVVARFPGRVRLDIYFAGERPDVKPTPGFQHNVKHQRVPCAYVNGEPVDPSEHADPERLAALVETALALDPSGWA